MMMMMMMIKEAESRNASRPTLCAFADFRTLTATATAISKLEIRVHWEDRMLRTILNRSAESRGFSFLLVDRGSSALFIPRNRIDEMSTASIYRRRGWLHGFGDNRPDFRQRSIIIRELKNPLLLRRTPIYYPPP